MTEAAFRDKDWYRLRVLPGAKMQKSRGGVVFAQISFEVQGGPMEGKPIGAEWYLTNDDKSIKYFVRKLEALGFDAIKTNLRELGAKLVGKQCWGQCEIQAKLDEKQQIKGYWPPKITDVRDLNSMIVGGPESDAAAILGNTVTPAGDDDEWNDQI